MVLLIAAIVAVSGWALWTGRLKTEQLPPLLLAAAGGFIALRGQWLFGLGAVAVGVVWYRGLFARLLAPKPPDTLSFAIQSARQILGVTAHYNADQIRARHRKLMAAYHPDRGGDSTSAQQLNEARDLLLHDLERHSR